MDKCEKLQLPPANSSEFPNNSDTISRQAAIEIVDRYNKSHMILKGKPMLGAASIVIELEALPSAQPEIIRCKDCKWGAQDEVGRWFCRSLGCQIGNEDGSGYCADAERRTDEQN